MLRPTPNPYLCRLKGIVRFLISLRINFAESLARSFWRYQCGRVIDGHVRIYRAEIGKQVGLFIGVNAPGQVDRRLVVD